MFAHRPSSRCHSRRVAPAGEPQPCSSSSMMMRLTRRAGAASLADRLVPVTAGPSGGRAARAALSPAAASIVLASAFAAPFRSRMATHESFHRLPVLWSMPRHLILAETARPLPFARLTAVTLSSRRCPRASARRPASNCMRHHLGAAHRSPCRRRRRRRPRRPRGRPPASRRTRPSRSG